MLFNSDIFLFCFLPVVLLGFFLLGARGGGDASRVWLAAASFVFYGWWNVAYVPLLLGSVVFNFVLARRLGVESSARFRGPLLALGVAANLGLLGWFKYANFLVESWNFTTGTGIELAAIVLPIGISFFTFQQIAYLVDARRGEAEGYPFLDYLVFVTFFPQLIAGPIVHHDEVMPQLRRATFRLGLPDLVTGVSIFLVGLFKKVVLADGVAPHATVVFDAAAKGDELTLFAAWLGTFAYAFQIYFDFSGYSDMAIGLGRMFGIRLPINFDSPYKATNITDLWQRWHITLTRWLRAYVFTPLARGTMRRADERLEVVIIAASRVVTMTLCGIWHGAGWTFVLWGLLHGLLLVLHQAWRSLRVALGRPAGPGHFATRGLGTAVTFVVFAVSLVLFRADSLDAALALLRGLSGANGVLIPESFGWMSAIGAPTGWVEHWNDRGLVWLLALGAITWAMPNTQEIFRSYLDVLPYRIRELTGRERRFVWHPTGTAAVVVGLVAIVAIGSLWQPTVFIYFQF